MGKMLHLIHRKPLSTKRISKIKLSVTSKTGKGVGVYGLNLPTKRAAIYYQQLFEMVLLLGGCCPEANPINPYKRLEKKIDLPEHLPRERLLLLYQLLVRASVLFNRTHRLKQKGKLVVSREDVVNALTLIRPLAFPESMLPAKTRKFYFELLNVAGQEKEVTRHELVKRLNYHPQKVWRHVLLLIEAGYVCLVRKGANGIYYFRIEQSEEE